MLLGALIAAIVFGILMIISNLHSHPKSAIARCIGSFFVIVPIGAIIGSLF